MRVRIRPATLRSGEISVPGDKSIAHRWLILSALATGTSELAGLPAALDVRSTASCLAALVPSTRDSLSAWVESTRPHDELPGFTWDEPAAEGSTSPLRVEGEGWSGVREPSAALDCGNSGTTMRLLLGAVAGAPIGATFVGDESLSRRPMERVAAPLRRMGASVRTSDGLPPVELRGGALHGIDESLAVASSQVKSAILLAGAQASGRTVIRRPVPTRDHTERALSHLGADIEITAEGISVAASELRHFTGMLPGDPSSVAFLLVAAAMAGSALVVRNVGLNPTRTAYLALLRRAGLAIEERIISEEVGEPVGTIELRARTAGLRPMSVTAQEFPLLADEIPILAVLATAAQGTSRFAGAGELRVKESDRLAGIVEGLRALGAEAAAEGDDLVMHGTGSPLGGGTADARGDHRLAMAFAVAATGAREASTIIGMESADVTFPGFVQTLRQLGAGVEPV